MRDQFAAAARHLMQGAIAEKASSLVNGLVLLRLLSLTEYGSLVLIYSVYSVVDVLIGFALGDLIVARCCEAEGRDADVSKADALLRSYMLLMMVTAAGVGVVALVSQEVIVTCCPGVESLYPLLIAAGMTAPIRGVVLTHLRIRHDFAGVKRADLVRAFTLTGGYLIGVGLLGLGLAGAIGAYAVANLAPLLSVGRRLFPMLVRALVAPAVKPIVGLMMDEGKWQTLRFGVTSLHGSTRPWLIQAVLGTEAVAVFDAAKTVTGASVDLLPLKEALVPLMSRHVGRLEYLQELYRDSVRCGIWIFGAIGCVMVLLAPLLFTSIFPAYEGAILVTQVMCIGLLTSGFATPQAALMYALRLQPLYFTTTLLSFALLFILGIPLMLLWGTVGMAVAMVAGGVATAALRHVALTRSRPELKMSWREWLPLRAIDREFFKALVSRETPVVSREVMPARIDRP